MPPSECGNKMRDYSSNNYCDFLWVSDLLELNRDANNVFSLEILKNQKLSKIAISYVTLFGTIVGVKQVGCQNFLYQLDDGTGVIACKHSEKQFEEILSVIENQQEDVLNNLSETQQSFEQSSVADYSGDDSVFNDRTLQMDEVNINKKCKLKGLLNIWDDIYKSFSALVQPYDLGDFVIIQGKLYTYFNTKQIYINRIRAVDLMEELMLVSVKLEENSKLFKETKISKAQTDSEKRLSGLITFDNIPHLNTKISILRNVEVIDLSSNDEMNSAPEVVTPNLKSSITFDTFTNYTLSKYFYVKSYHTKHWPNEFFISNLHYTAVMSPLGHK